MHQHGSFSSTSLFLIFLLDFQNESYIKLPSLLGSYGAGIVQPRFPGPPYLPPPVPYPVYYYSPPGQSGPVYPIRPGVPYHIGAPNPWTGFPAPSPTGGQGNSNWLQNVKKKPMDARKDDGKISGDCFSHIESVNLFQFSDRFNFIVIPQEGKSPALAEIKPVIPNIEAPVNQPVASNLILENYLRASQIAHHQSKFKLRITLKPFRTRSFYVASFF